MTDHTTISRTARAQNIGSTLTLHIQLAQESSLPGSIASGRPLHRISKANSSDTEKLKDRNRNWACGRSTKPTGDTHSCNEYPMASTYEGGWTRGVVGIAPTAPMPQPSNWQPRTFASMPCWPGGLPQPAFPIFDDLTGTEGVSACVIDADHNELGGSDLGAWYTKVRIQDEEAFHIHIAP
ncbi:hypothetical protein GCM10010182_80140 [Actinomadura cremea]|nr:hypothetical protein GCM10010182_80140 [Actinomadura cremea]